MVIIKTPEQIEGIRKSCQVLSSIMKELVAMAKPGVSPADLDAHARKRMQEAGGIPAFLGYQAYPGGVPFPSAVCSSINDTVVHGLSVSTDPLKEGDIISMDCGVNLNGYFSDMAVTVAIGAISEDVQKMLDVTKKSLEAGIAEVAPGKKIRSIAQAIEDVITPHGYGIIRDFAGHGVGLNVHEDPWIPNYVSRRFASELNVELKAGMVIAIEPMVTMGGEDVHILDDGWTVNTSDGSLSGHFEHTILVTDTGHEVLTKMN